MGRSASNTCTHQAVFFEHKNTCSFVERTRGQSPSITAPGDGVNFRAVCRKLATFAVVFKILVHLMIIRGRHAAIRCFLPHRADCVFKMDVM